MVYVGIDVSKSALDVAALCEAGEIRHQRFSNTQAGHAELNLWLKGLGVCHIVFEATGSYHERLAQALGVTEAPFSIVNPAQTSYFVRSQHRRNKTDKADAVMLAVYAKERQPVPTLLTNPLPQSITRELNTLQKDLTRLRNRVEAAEQGLTHPEVLAFLQRRIAALEEEKRLLEQELEQETKGAYLKELELLTSIPGVGLRTACMFLAEVGAVSRFATASKLVAYAGLTPALFESGSSVNRRTRISRLGPSSLRYLLYMPSLAAIRYNPMLKNFFNRLVEKGKNKKAAVVAWRNFSGSCTACSSTSAPSMLTTWGLDSEHSISPALSVVRLPGARAGAGGRTSPGRTAA